MTTPLWCLMIVAILPYASAGLGAYYRIQQLGSLDANHPRVQALELRNVAARAYGSQSNSWEALSFFGAAVLCAHLAGADPEASATAATIYVVARVAHLGLYISDLAPARTGAFVIGMACCFRLFQLAAVA